MCVSNKLESRPCWLLAASVLALSLTATAAGALTINDTFLPTFTGTAVTEAQVQAATNAVAALYSNSATINILFGAGGAFSDGASETELFLNSYSNYVKLLGSNSLSNPANTTLATAVANLPNGNGGANPGPVASTPAQLRALGQNVAGGFDQNGNMVVGGTYDGVIMIGNLASISVVLHEVDEVLGGGGSGSALDFSCGSTCYGSLDLYRYSAPGVGSFTTDPSATAYLSFDGGLTDVANFNQNSLGDLGDFVGPNDGPYPCLIQSWEVCGPTDSFVVGSVEYQMLESIGYDPTPLPAALPLFATGLGALGLLGWRRKRKAQAGA
jgi:hypothetical protein